MPVLRLTERTITVLIIMSLKTSCNRVIFNYDLLGLKIDDSQSKSRTTSAFNVGIWRRV